VRVLRGGEAVGDETLWSAPGEPVEGVVAVEVEREPSESEDEHAHEGE
jgi:hypothetical protein